jgi:hypothetical protein
MTETGFVDPVEEKVLSRIPLETGGISLLAAILSLLFFEPLVAALIFGGGLTAAAGFIWLKRMVFRLVQSDRKTSLSSLFLVYGLRILLIIGLFFIIILFFSKKILAFTAGFSMIIPVFFLEAVGALTRMKKWKN